MPQQDSTPTQHGFRAAVHRVIFGTDTPSGKLFDVALIFLIGASVIAVMLDSIPSVKRDYGLFFSTLEWIFTIAFSIEYILRLISVDRPLRYAFSFYGIVDLLATIPTYLSLILPGSQYFLVIRVLRVLRIFRVLKLVQFVGESQLLTKALIASRHKIIVFLFFVCTNIVIIGSVMYLVEQPDAGFSSIPESIYWTIVTLTTVGYGDIAPVTPLGKFLASFVMILGYSILAVPTGIVTAEISRARHEDLSGIRSCRRCASEDNDADANYCKFCGEKLP